MGSSLALTELNLVFLHGFLGHPRDFETLITALRRQILFRSFSADYTTDPLLNPTHGLPEWGGNFWRWVDREKIRGSVVLIGYSQGARLALHALADSPERVSRVIAISGNPGLADESARTARLERDVKWAQRFIEEDWSSVLRAWNEQPVFHGGAREPERTESAESRRLANQALRSWSVARQTDFRELLRCQAAKIRWVFGEKDVAYAGLARDLKKEIPELKLLEIPGAGHRVIWDGAEILAQRLGADFKASF